MSEQQTHGATRAARMAAVLRAAFSPTVLDVEDESARHAGHAGARAGGQTHYKVTIVAERFTGLNRLARSRLVNEVLTQEFNSGLHALSLVLRSPGE